MKIRSPSIINSLNIVCILVSIEIILATEGNTNHFPLEDSTRILSRRKRFLIFPDGSSFQLVFCAQNMGYLQLGDIVWFGNTAALAWELPTDPDLLLKLKKHDKLLYPAQNRDGASKLLYYLDEKGNVLSKVPYRKRPIVNPAFAKRSIDDKAALEEFNTTIRELHVKQKNVRVFDNLDDAAIDFHRKGRQSLYEHLDTFIGALGWRGEECVLRLLCEFGKGSATDQGTFLEEIFRATFTLPEGRKFDGDLYKNYDEAHRATGDCANLYSQCKQTVKH